MGPEDCLCELLAPDPAVLETELGTELCLLHRVTDEVLVLNTTAADLWRLLDGTTSLEDAVALLARAYQVPPEQVLADVAPLVQDWRDRGFLVAGNSS